VASDLVVTYEAALVRYQEAVGALVPLLRGMAVAELVSVLPGAAQLVTFGEVNEDGVPILRIQRVLDADGGVLFDAERADATREVGDQVDRIGYEYLDRLLDVTGDDYCGEQTWSAEQ
jgi:hypothetical protein